LRCRAAEESSEFAEVLQEVVNRSAVSIHAALSAAVAVCLIPIGTAQAERFGPQYRSWEGYEYAPFSSYERSWGTGDYQPFRQKRHRAHTKHESRPKADSQRQRAAKSHESEPKAKSQEVGAVRAPRGDFASLAIPWRPPRLTPVQHYDRNSKGLMNYYNS
jgi:hypothetical protein